MSMIDPRVEHAISVFIPGQFPDFYREEGPLFVEFVKKYYEWMEEEGNTLYHSRRLMSYKDVDSTVDDFIVHFKQKYLNGIQFTTETDVRRLIKNSLDLFRTKGSERSIDLLFRLVFGAGAEIYYPSKDIFRLSDGQWINPVYLELTPSPFTTQMVSRQVRGGSSGARGFVERVIRIKFAGGYSDIAFLSQTSGVFQKGEVLNRNSTPFIEEDCPRIVGSMAELEIENGGSGYTVGQAVEISGGIGGEALVTAVTSKNGAVEYEILNGGFGYTANSEVYVSDSILHIPPLSTTSTNHIDLFQTISQKIATIEYESSNGIFNTSEEIFAYHANNDLKGSAIVIGSTDLGSGEGLIVASVVSGNVEGGDFYTTSNAVVGTISVDGYSETVTTGRILDLTHATLIVDSVVGTFSIGEKLVQTGGASGVVSSYANERLVLTDIAGKLVAGEISGLSGSANITSISLSLAVIVDTGTGFITGHHLVTDEDHQAITFISSGTGFDVELGTISNQDTFDINSDNLIDYVSVDLDAVAYGFPAEPTANLSSIIETCFSYDTYTFGSVESLVLTGFGENYDTPPIIRIYEPLSYALTLSSQNTIYFTDATASFVVGEKITHTVTNAVGIILELGSDFMVIQKLTFSAVFVPGEIFGETTGTTANATVINTVPFTTAGRKQIGADATVPTSAVIASGVVTGLRVSKSGFQYYKNPSVTFSPVSGDAASGTATISRFSQGTGSGYYRKIGGVLSGSKKLFDGDYYQEYSYEVRSSIVFDNYEQMLRNVLHVAGTKMFGALITNARLASPVSITTSLTISEIA